MAEEAKTIQQPEVVKDPKAAEKAEKPSVSESGGFKNDPDDSTNPNEAIERHRRTVRP